MSTANDSSSRVRGQTSNLPRFYGSIEGPSDRAPRAWPPYMTARIAADYSDTSPWTVRRHVQPCGRRGRTFVYSIDAVEQWMRGASFTTLRERASVQQPTRRLTTKRGKGESTVHIGRARVEDRKHQVTK